MTQEKAENYLKRSFSEVQPRTITIMTGVGGYDLFDEAMDNEMGYKRVYLAVKLIRWTRLAGIQVKTSMRGTAYKHIPKPDLPLVQPFKRVKAKNRKRWYRILKKQTL
jgi:hypothetical protein